MYNDFNLNSDHPLDKTIYILDDLRISNNGQYSMTITIPHGLKFKPLVFGNWSFDRNFNLAFEYFSGPVAALPSFGEIISPRVGVRANENAVELTITSLDRANVSMYCRVFAFKPTDASTSLVFSPTNKGVDDFMVNTDLIQPQLIEQGFVDTPYLQPGQGTWRHTVEHKLGYRPQVMAWNDIDGYMQPHVSVAFGGGRDSLGIESTVNTLEITANAPSINRRLHYRIYGNV